MNRRQAIGVAIVIIGVAFVFFVPVVPDPASAPQPWGPFKVVTVSVTYYLFGAGGAIWRNEMSPAQEQGYTILWFGAFT